MNFKVGDMVRTIDGHHKGIIIKIYNCFYGKMVQFKEKNGSIYFCPIREVKHENI